MAKEREARRASPLRSPFDPLPQGANPSAAAEPASAPAPAAPAPVSVRETVLQPTIHVTEHDDSIYRGSLNAVTGEGYDPCHEEQLSSLSAAQPSGFPAQEEARPGLQLAWGGSDIVRGFVMGEILRRK